MINARRSCARSSLCIAGQDLICRLDVTNTGTMLLKDVTVPLSPDAKSGSTACNFPTLGPSATAYCTMLWRATQPDFDHWDELYEAMASGPMVRRIEVNAVASATPLLTAHAADEVAVPLTTRPALNLTTTRWVAPAPPQSCGSPMCMGPCMGPSGPYDYQKSDPLCCGAIDYFSAISNGQSCPCYQRNPYGEYGTAEFISGWSRPMYGIDTIVPGTFPGGSASTRVASRYPHARLLASAPFATSAVEVEPFLASQLSNSMWLLTCMCMAVHLPASSCSQPNTAAICRR